MTRRGRRRWGVMSHFVIGDGLRVHLDRLRILQTPWMGLYLHSIQTADAQRHVHDHPWPFISLVLRGGYTEDFAPVPHVHHNLNRHKRVWRRWTWHRMDTDQAHRIVEVKPRTLTLVVVGRPVEREWGFFTDDGRIEWSDYPDTMKVMSGRRSSLGSDPVAVK